MNQRTAVFTVVSSVCKVNGTKVEPTKEQLKVIHDQVFKAFKSGDVDYKGGIPNDEKLIKYIPGLVNNWLRKDLRLNGGTEYVTKNPGSRSGSKDEQLQAMRALLAASTSSDARTQIQAAIDARMAELKPQVKIDITKLPEHLRVWAENLEAERNAE
jgi:hypothetical protein